MPRSREHAALSAWMALVQTGLVFPLEHQILAWQRMSRIPRAHHYHGRCGTLRGQVESRLDVMVSFIH
jgi:hypothetical protein